METGDVAAITTDQIGAMSTAQVVARLDEAQIANARMNDMAGVWPHPQLAARERWHTVGSRFFQVWGRLRMADRTQEETALILRDSGNVSFVWRQKIAGILPPPKRESLLQSSQP